MLTNEGLKERLRAASVAAAPFPDDRFRGRGIVMCAGGARLFTCAWVAIGMLRRHLGCALPIEVWHLGPDEMGLPQRALLEELDAQPVDAFEVAKRHPVDRLGGWELKPYALMHSQFREVLLLDADNVPVRDPGFLFDRPEFVDSGALFWPDIVRIAPNNAIWEISGTAFRDLPSFESGQMVLDKSRCWRALALTHRLNQDSDVVYRHLHGDKDTFLIAWLMLNQPFHLIPYRPKRLESTLCQRDPDGGLLFQHRNGAKWILDGTNPRIAGFRLEDECRALLDELATVWDGRIFNPPPRSQRARQLEAKLAGARVFIYTRVSSDARRIELRPDHRVVGAGENERYWCIADAADGPELRIEGMGLPCCVLKPAEAGIWRGRLLQPPQMPVELAAIGGEAGDAESHGATSDGPLALVGSILDLGASVPWDGETARDLVGSLRVLALLDPEVIECLEAEGSRSPASSLRGRLVRAALAGLADRARRPDQGGVAAGHGWLDAAFKLGRGYRR
ncbi:MAG TPA: hypothetical protein VFX06_12310 [Stellaceae bacterium]|nr:hypothetical protein [Stellaceae bacterium]